MRALAIAVAVAVAGLLVTGCSGTRLLDHHAPTPRPKTPQPKTAPGRTYLQQLTAEQGKLSQAERAIPKRARTPAALSRSIGLLATAIGALAKGLSSIRPPGPVTGLHARLVQIVRIYYRRLTAAASIARTRSGEIPAANSLATATESATNSFTVTFAQITARLAR